MRTLLAWKEHAPTADCCGGEALVEAARGGHEAVVRMLLSQCRHAARADCQDGLALVAAAGGGHEAVVRLPASLSPRMWQGVTAKGGLAVTEAAKGGHRAIFQLLTRCWFGGSSAKRLHLADTAGLGDDEAISPSWF